MIIQGKEYELVKIRYSGKVWQFAGEPGETTFATESHITRFSAAEADRFNRLTDGDGGTGHIGVVLLKYDRLRFVTF